MPLPEIRNLFKSFGGLMTFSDLQFDLHSGNAEKVHVIRDNDENVDSERL
jgi:hypothetical protein